MDLLLVLLWSGLSIIHMVCLIRAVANDDFTKATYHSVWFLAAGWWIQHLTA